MGVLPFPELIGAERFLGDFADQSGLFAGFAFSGLVILQLGHDIAFGDGPAARPAGRHQHDAQLPLVIADQRDRSDLLDILDWHHAFHDDLILHLTL